MHLRELAKQQWANSGIYRIHNARLQEFLKYFDDTPLECWNEYVPLFRKKYYEFFDQLVVPLFQSRDKLMRTVLIRQANVRRPRELAFLEEFVQRADPLEDQPELKAVLALKSKYLTNKMQARPELAELFKSASFVARKPINMTAPKRIAGPRRSAAVKKPARKPSE